VLVNALKHNTCLESLFFHDNTIQLEAVSYVTEMLQIIKSLKHTDMVYQVGHAPVAPCTAAGGGGGPAIPVFAAARAVTPEEPPESELAHAYKSVPLGEAH
jgi:hypothetical protein